MMSIETFRERVQRGFETLAECGEKIIRFSASGDEFGNTELDQIRGRDRAAKLELVKAVSMMAVALIMALAPLHLECGGWILTGLFALGGFISMKEAILHTFARAKEKKEYIVEDENLAVALNSDWARYTVCDCAREVVKKWRDFVNPSPPEEVEGLLISS